MSRQNPDQEGRRVERRRRIEPVRAASDGPAARPLRERSAAALQRHFRQAIDEHDGLLGAHCVHEAWMRGAEAGDVERWIEELWGAAAASVPDWLPMRYVEWLPTAYAVAAAFRGSTRGRSNIYLILLDYSDRCASGFGLYVGMSTYDPLERFDQHKSGIRAAGSVLKRGVEVLTGPTLHLRRIKRADAARIEADLAAALASAGLLVKGGH